MFLRILGRVEAVGGAPVEAIQPHLNLENSVSSGSETVKLWAVAFKSNLSLIGFYLRPIVVYN